MTRISRRTFFRASGVAAAGAALTGSDASPQGARSAGSKIKRLKPLGRTGWMVGDISGGSGQTEPAVVEYLFQSGINLIDTGQQYGGHEEIIGKVLPKWRSKVFVVDKWDPPLVTPTVTKAALLESLDVSLQKLNTTYIDCMMIHSIGNPKYGGLERIQNPAIYEAWDEAKKRGKIRFTGASSHGPKLEDMNWGIDNGRFDMILVGANYVTKGVEPLLKRARAKGIATIAMKAMAIFQSNLNIRALQNRQTSARQACVKWILASDLFDTMVVRMPSFDQADEYLAVSGTTRLGAEDRRNLEIVRAAVTHVYCRPGCDGCLGACPRNVPVADILRYKMYFENYREEKYAIGKYDEVPAARRAGNCRDCDAPCEAACPYGVRIRERLAAADTQLTLTRRV
jgi:predicted aldo/keto reductase-like oxidoreductase